MRRRSDVYNQLFGDFFDKNKSKKEQNKEDIIKEEESQLSEKNEKVIKKDKNEKISKKEKSEFEKKILLEISKKSNLQNPENIDITKNLEKPKNNTKLNTQFLEKEYKSKYTYAKKNEGILKFLGIELSEKAKNKILIESEIEKNGEDKNLRLKLPYQLKTDENLVFLFSLINKFIEIREYIEKNFSKRFEDVEKIDEKVSFVKNLILSEDLNKNKTEELKTEIGDFNLEFIVGINKEEKTKKLESLRKKIKEEKKKKKKKKKTRKKKKKNFFNSKKKKTKKKKKKKRKMKKLRNFIIITIPIS